MLLLVLYISSVRLTAIDGALWMPLHVDLNTLWPEWSSPDIRIPSTGTIFVPSNTLDLLLSGPPNICNNFYNVFLRIKYFWNSSSLEWIPVLWIHQRLPFWHLFMTCRNTCKNVCTQDKSVDDTTGAHLQRIASYLPCKLRTSGSRDSQLSGVTQPSFEVIIDLYELWVNYIAGQSTNLTMTAAHCCTLRRRGTCVRIFWILFEYQSIATPSSCATVPQYFQCFFHVSMGALCIRVNVHVIFYIVQFFRV